MTNLDYNSLLKDIKDISTPEGEAAFREKVKNIVSGQTSFQVHLNLSQDNDPD